MIVDFTVENFRSLKTEQVLSLYVEHPKKHLVHHVAFPAGDKIGVLRSLGIYGANASGKSNVLLALRALQYVACVSGDLKEGEKIGCYEPYLLSETTADAPIRFEVEFFNTDNIRYRYVVSFNDHAIIEESLDFYPSRQRANIFRRGATDTWETISFGSHYKGGAKRIPFFKNNSYLSKAGNNAGSADIVRSVFAYLLTSWKLPNDYESMMGPLYEEDSMLALSAMFLRNVDTGIEDVSARDMSPPSPDSIPQGIPSYLKNMMLERSKKRYIFEHKTEEGNKAEFRMAMESRGTQRLFAMLPSILEVMTYGQVLVLDEIDASLHPDIAELLVRLFNDPEVNRRNAQLIFTTHSQNLMSSRDMRRDQIWFVRKINGSSELYSLDDFDKERVKADSPFEHWYDEGRFGALPSIRYEEITKLFKEIDKARQHSENVRNVENEKLEM